ncbi:MAG: SdrD B-like domain-containing protein [Anaerolineae bacterium]
MNIRTLHQSKRRRLLVLLLPALVALLAVALVIGSLTVSAFGNLTVTFTEGPPDTIKAGESYTFTVEVTNNGTTDPPAEAVVFEYRAPAGVVITSIESDAPGDCEVGTEGDPSDPSICSLGNMDPDPEASVTIDVEVSVPPDVPEGTILDNDVRAWQFGTEEEPPDNESHAYVEVETEADLEITKTARGDNVVDYDEDLRQFIKEQWDDEVTAGELLEYTLEVTNDGPSDAQNVVVTDTLPLPAGPIATVNFVSADGADCRQDPVDRNLVTCDLGTVPAETSRTIHILVRVDPSVYGVITNWAAVSSTTTDPDTDNNEDYNETYVNVVADVWITKEDVPAEARLDQPFEPDQAIAGNEHRYLITFGNDGPSVAWDVEIVDYLDYKQADILGETFVRCEPIEEEDEVICDYDEEDGEVWVEYFWDQNEEIFYDYDGILNPGDEFSFWLITEVDPGYVLDADNPSKADPLIAENWVEIVTDWMWGDDYRDENNEESEYTEIIAEADLQVTKTDTPDPVQNLYYDPVTNKFVYTYTLTIENLGPSDAAKVVLIDTLPVDATFIEFSTQKDTLCYFRDDGILFCLVGNDDNNEGDPERGRLNVGITSTVKIVVEADASAVDFLENCVEVKAIAEDEFPFNGADPVGDPIPPADFQDGRTPTPDPNLANNSFCEITSLVNPVVKVDKKVYVRRSPVRGIDVTTDGLTEAERCAAYATDDVLTLPGDELTYCYTITNEGDTWLHSITLGDLSDALIYRAPITDFTVVDPAQPPLRGTISRAGTGEAQTITIATTEPAVAVLAPKGVPDDYDHILIIRTFTVDFPELGPFAGVVWEDTNGNHVVDLHEPLLAGLGVDLLNESGFPLVLRTTTTDAKGRYAFHDVAPGRYLVQVYEPGSPPVILGVSPLIEFDVSQGYSIANFDGLTSEWYIEFTFRMLGTNTARVDAIPSTKYSTPYPGIEPSGDCQDPDLVCDTDLLHDTLALPVLEETTKEWDIYEDDGDGLPGPGDIIEYTVDIPNTGIIEATGVVFTDILYNYINDAPEYPWVPATLINGSVSAAIHVYGRDPITGRVIDADVQPPDLAFGQNLLLRTQAPAIGDTYLEFIYPSAIVLDSEILKGNNPGDDEVRVATRLAIPPVGYLLRFDGVTYSPPIPVTFSLRIKYQVRIKVSKYVPLGTIILNHGWLSYNEISLFDQRFPDFDPTNVDRFLATNKVATNHAGTPGRAWESYEFPGWPEVPANVEPTNYPGDRFDDYARPDAALRDDDDPTWFEVERAPRRIQLPAIDNAGGWETLIQVQNAGDDDTGVIVFFWGEYSGKCPSNDPGPVGHDCKWVAENGVWPLEAQDIPSTARSAIVYSVDEDLFDQACWDAADAVDDSAAWRGWEDDYEGTGEAIAVIARRKGPNDYGTVVSSAYPGISENMEGSGPPYKYFAPYAMRQYHGLDTEIIIQNSGERCTQVWLDYQKQGDCEFSYSDHIGRLAPGESIRIRVPESLGVEWLGSIYVESDEPLGIIMDQTSFPPSDDQGVLLTYRARPYRLPTDTVFYADLVWRELSGWEASIQVQNLTQQSLPTFVTVEFFDASGDSILVVGDWVCRNGGTTFYLPAIADLGMEYAGAAVIQSHPQVDYPGEDHDGEPIFVVVDLKKTKVYDETKHGWRHTVPGEIQGGAYNAHAESEKKGAGPIMLPFLAKAKDSQGVTSLIAVRNNSNCNNIKLKLEVRKGTGTVITYLTNFWLSPGHIKLIDLANVGSLSPGFLGAGIVTVDATSVQQLCDRDNDGLKDNEPIMPSVVVVNKGTGPGDVTEVYEGLPQRDP